MVRFITFIFLAIGVWLVSTWLGSFVTAFLSLKNNFMEHGLMTVDLNVWRPIITVKLMVSVLVAGFVMKGS